MHRRYDYVTMNRFNKPDCMRGGLMCAINAVVNDMEWQCMNSYV